MDKNHTDIMLDLETCALTPDAQILSISAVAFNPFENNPDYLSYPTFDILVDLDCQADNRVANDDTLDWWCNQPKEIRDYIFNEEGRITLVDALHQLNGFVKGCTRIWSPGTDMDITILKHAHNQLRIALPWKYWAVRDSRTLLDLVETDIEPATHNSLADCFRQVMGVQQALAKLGITKFQRN